MEAARRAAFHALEEATMKVGLLGSCVSREPLKYLEREIPISWYQARTTIPSMGAPPVYFPISFVNSDVAPFDQRNVAFDSAKAWLGNIHRKDYDFLLIDFIDERFGCFHYKGSIVTRSSAFVAADVPEEVRREMRWVNPSSPEYRNLVKQYLPLFLEEITRVRQPVICNNVYWNPVRDDGSRDVAYSDERCLQMNRVLDEIYDCLKRLDNVTMLDIPRDTVIASASHKWGAAPFHYTDETDKVIADALLKAARLRVAESPSALVSSD
jgi:hypothetical protein